MKKAYCPSCRKGQVVPEYGDATYRQTRDRALLRRYSEGVSIAILARETGLHRMRVYQILNTLQPGCTKRPLLTIGNIREAMQNTATLKSMVEYLGHYKGPHAAHFLAARLRHSELAEEFKRWQEERAFEATAARIAKERAGYLAHARSLGYLPSSTWIFRNDRNLYARVSYVMKWKDFLRMNDFTPKRVPYGSFSHRGART